MRAFLEKLESSTPSDPLPQSCCYVRRSVIFPRKGKKEKRGKHNKKEKK
jgi:hypothetical protein